MHKVGLPARAYRNAGLSPAAWPNVFTKIPVDAADAADDVGGYFDVAAGATHARYNVPNPGVYRCLWVVTAVASADAQSTISALYRGNGGGAAAIECQGANAQGNGALSLMSSPGNIDVTCVAGDWLELWCFCNSARALQVGKAYCTISIQQVA